MSGKTASFPVYPISVFNTDSQCWMGAISAVMPVANKLKQLHQQSFYMLLFIRDGSANIVVDGNELAINGSSIICINTNSVCNVQFNKTTKGYFICFDDNFFSLRYNDNALVQFNFLHKGGFTVFKENESLFSKWDTILPLVEEEYTQFQKNAKVLRSYVNILLYSLQQAQHFDAPKKVDIKVQKVVMFEQLVEKHFIEEKLPSYYAHRLNVTANYLNKLCKLYRAATSGDIIKNRTILEAQRLLHYTPKPVCEIAYELGFESCSYFVTFFRKNTGYTPEKFRKRR